MRVKSRFLAGGAAGATLLAFTIHYSTGWEGRRYVSYRDVGGVWSNCDGHTGRDVHAGQRLTDEQCDALHREDAIRIESRLLACAPELADKKRVPDMTYVAINDWAYNVGAGAACRSTLIRMVKEGRVKQACYQLSKWVHVNGKVIAGLVRRRIKGMPGQPSEQALCLSGFK